MNRDTNKAMCPKEIVSRNALCNKKMYKLFELKYTHKLGIMALIHSFIQQNMSSAMVSSQINKTKTIS